MGSGLTFDAILDALADRLAERVRAELAQAGNGANVKPRLLSIEEAAIYLGRSEQAIRRMVQSGKIPKVQGDRRLQVDIADLDRWIEQNKLGQ